MKQQQKESKQQYQIRRQAEADRMSRELAAEIKELRTLLQRPLQKFDGLEKLKRGTSFPAASPPPELATCQAEPTWEVWKNLSIVALRSTIAKCFVSMALLKLSFGRRSPNFGSGEAR